MNEIIKVNDEKGTVSARELYDYLSEEDGIKGTERFSKWFERYCSYGFVEKVDYSTMYKKVRVQNEGGREVSREVDDSDISFDMAKQICILQRTEKGKQIRQYLIDLEKVWNMPEQVMARALKIADKTIASLKQSNITLDNKNKLLNKEILKWADRPLINALVRRYATVYDNDYSKAWRDFKRELLYKYSININARITNYLNSTGKKTKPKTLDMIAQEEVSDAICTAISLCDEHNIDISDLLQNKAS